MTRLLLGRRLPGILLGVGVGAQGGPGVFLNEFRCLRERLWTDAPVLCRPQQRLALDVPEAGRLVWVVDGQADGSNVLQSLCRAAEKVVVRG